MPLPLRTWLNLLQRPQSRQVSRWVPLALIGGSIVIVGTTAIATYWLIRTLILDTLQANALLTVQKTGNDIDRWLAIKQAEVETLANQSAIRSMNWRIAAPYLKLEATRLPDFRAFFIADLDGNYYRSDVGFVKGKNVRDRQYFQQAIAGKPNISGLIISRADGTRQINISAPILSFPPLNSLAEKGLEQANEPQLELSRSLLKKPKPIGVFTGIIPVVEVAEFVAKTSYHTKDSYAFILDSDGIPIAHPDAQLLQQGKSVLNTSNPGWTSVYQAMVDGEQGIQRVQKGKQSVYVAYSRLNQANWSLALVVPQKSVERQLDALNFQAAILGILLAIASIISLRLVRVLEQTQARTMELAQTNAKLEKEITQRETIQTELLTTQAELEIHVEARTAELAQANKVLQTSEVQLRQQAQQLEQALQDLQNTQSTLIQTEKMSSLGQLVAGIAHEINNPISFIYGNLPFVNQYIEDLIDLIKVYQRNYPNPVAEVIEEADNIDINFLMIDSHNILESMRHGAERIQKIVYSLRNFSRLDESARKRVDIHEGIDSALMILQHRLKPQYNQSAIDLVKLYKNPFLVECYPGQLNQVFMNILTNAIDAVETCKSPKISINTMALDEDWVEIRIVDNGIGMSEEVKNRIFDPFFTTKPIGKGTGIGMAISYQIIVEKHGGKLYCKSQLGKGTEFTIQIPKNT